MGERSDPVVSRAKRQANNRWDAENMKLVAAKIRKEKAEEFKRLCEKNGDSMNAVIQDAIDAYIQKHRGAEK